MEPDKRRHFTARSIEDIESQILAAGNSPERNILHAKKAFLFARHSFIAEAKTIITNLRAANISYEPRLSAWIMFAEGITEHAETFDIAKSRDRIVRAHLIGQVAKDAQLASTSAAWLAYFEFVRGKYRECSEFIEKAFEWSTELDSEARSRASMVVGAGFYFSGDSKTAKGWFQRSRAYAVKSGDIAMQNIILFNSSALHVSHLTLVDCTSSVDPAELKFAVMSAQSAGNLNTALGIANQPSMVPIQKAELYTIEKKWQLAIAIFDSHIDLLNREGQSIWMPKMLAHRAWCKANLSDAAGAESDISMALGNINRDIDPDDLSVLHFRVANTAKLLGNSELADQQENLARDSLRALEVQQALVREYFEATSKRIDPQTKNPA